MFDALNTALAYLACFPVVLGFFWAACPCCSLTCPICSSSACGWTQTAGTWVDTAGVFTTSSANGIYLSNTQHPSGTAALTLSVAMNFSTAGDMLRIIADYADSSNFLFLEVVSGAFLGTASASLYRKTAGVDTLLASLTGLTIVIAHDYGMVLCLTADGVFATVDTGQGTFFADNVNATNPSFGLGTGGTMGGTDTFKGFTATRTDGTCTDCVVTSCSVCSSTTQPRDTLAITFSGLIRSTVTPCTADLSGTLNSTTYIVHTYAACSWSLNFTISGIPCALSVGFAQNFGPPTYILVTLQINNAPQYLQFQVNLTADDCTLPVTCPTTYTADGSACIQAPAGATATVSHV